MAAVRSVDGDPNGAWEDVSWADMSSEEQELWGIVGWDADSWEEETDPPEADDSDWGDLGSEVQDALTKLGYTQALWDEE
ncbi:MAG: hypothetical protein EA001_03960 [Oscillatoriales cyanobacterium]|nr:MAG: hypothetical protein EA001_03960 [Oscillatoriales cyanobacterium]